jgi:hypothetical protein
VPGDGEDGVADGDQGAFLSPALDDPLVARSQEGAGPGRCYSGFSDGAAEPGLPVRDGGLATPGGLPGLGRELSRGDQEPSSLLSFGAAGCERQPVPGP